MLHLRPFALHAMSADRTAVDGYRVVAGRSVGGQEHRQLASRLRQVRNAVGRRLHARRPAFAVQRARDTRVPHQEADRRRRLQGEVGPDRIGDEHQPSTGRAARRRPRAQETRCPDEGASCEGGACAADAVVVFLFGRCGVDWRVAESVVDVSSHVNFELPV